MEKKKLKPKRKSQVKYTKLIQIYNFSKIKQNKSHNVVKYISYY